MSNARKLQTEIDRVMKKVDEGELLFDEIWEKVYSAEQQNQKEKYEMDLKKEIKKLQRLRDQIKTWIGSAEVKDKGDLVEARKRIEQKMEQFKICEKETKTKTYSKEGLAREERLDPAEEAKLNTTSWLGEYIERLRQMVEEHDFELEKLVSGKGKKTNKAKIEELQNHVLNHKNHISKLEGVIRLVNNDRLDIDTVDAFQEDLDYYMDSYADEDYMSAYDEDFFYEPLGLEDLDVVNVDRLTQAAVKKDKDDTETLSSKGSSKDKKGKSKAVASVIPLTIGRARVSKADKKNAEKEAAKEEEKVTPTKPTPSQPVHNGVPAPVARSPPAPATAAPGASMAAILKRESEQEKERQQKILREQQARQAEQARQQQEEQLRQQEALRLQQIQQQQQQQAQQEALKRQQQEAQMRQQQEAQQAAKLQAQQAAEQKAQTLQNSQMQLPPNNSMELLSVGLSGVNLGGSERAEAPLGGSLSQSSGAADPGSSFLSTLNESFLTAPGNAENERSRQYTPQNPYPTPASYPTTPATIFENPAVFEKLGIDCLFFIFYYAQGTYQQYLAARELKKQSWRFHKKYMTWFQRHEEPKITTDEYEQGTYVYFDYETGWCTRIKTDFRFEYSYLEDSLQ
ncbi:CCR4-NOT transcription complex subunit 3 [Fistulifera solaris]|uniref:CCR4-NOT transcription complex subunit 3 n=1 Tax=Fistulifera solaris TaxID=1519565 RepID=A0A1Z5J7Q2_FISSO|nr:CCR4-NOT transcription complex subunit 3 [Fistulifera solaris]|eukprot:GAX09811.1 CCR4-NOT transcription complex subunit 3 [Fistulifera solaris]